MADYYGEPQRETQFDSQVLEPPVRVTAAGGGGEAGSPGYYPPSAPEASRSNVEGAPTPDYRSTGQTPVNSGLETQANRKGQTIYNSRLMPRNLVVTSLILRAAAAVSLIVAIAVLASDSHTLFDSNRLTGYSTFNVSTFSSTRYALAAAIIGAVYSIYETISVAVRLAMRHPLLPGNFSLFVSYIGDQIVLVLLLSGASAAAATLRDLHVLPPTDDTTYCDYIQDWCNQGAGAVAMIFLGFCFVAASLVISSYCFYTGRS